MPEVVELLWYAANGHSIITGGRDMWQRDGIHIRHHAPHRTLNRIGVKTYLALHSISLIAMLTGMLVFASTYSWLLKRWQWKKKKKNFTMMLRWKNRQLDQRQIGFYRQLDYMISNAHDLIVLFVLFFLYFTSIVHCWPLKLRSIHFHVGISLCRTLFAYLSWARSLSALLAKCQS